MSKNIAQVNSKETSTSIDSLTQANVNMHGDNILKKSIQPRHVLMMSMATGIGTGLLVGNGKSISDAGVGGTLISYGIITSMLFCCMQSVGELVVAFPSLAGGFNSYGKKFVDASFGFTVAWLFCLQWMIVLPLELITASMIIKFWNERISPSIFVGVFYIIICMVNFLGAKGYVEAEFIFNSLKLMMIIGFIILGIVIDCGGAGTTGKIGLRFLENPGLFNLNNDIIKAIASTLVNGCFSCGGIEFIALSAAEQNRDNMPKSIRNACYQVLVRMCTFFLVSIFIVGLLVPYNSPRLMGSGSDLVHSSPYVIAMEIHGIKVIPHIINSIILVAVISVANSAMYSSSRTLHSLAEQGFAPKYFNKIDSKGKPLRCLVVSAIIGLLSFIAEYKDQERIFIWLLSISGLSTIFTWAMISIAHIRFRAAMIQQNNSLDQLGYQSLTGVFGSYYALFINIICLVAQFWVSLFPLNGNGKPDMLHFFQNYMAALIALLLYIAHKICTKNWSFLIKPKDINITNDRDIYIFIDPPGNRILAPLLCDKQKLFTENILTSDLKFNEYDVKSLIENPSMGKSQE